MRDKLKVGNKVFSHKALCIDDIPTEFSIGGIGTVVLASQQNGFNVADNNFDSTSSGFVEKIELILGTDADHILPMSYRTFGNPLEPNTLSSFIDTPIGVIFSGNISKMITNLDFLPKQNNNFPALISKPSFFPREISKFDVRSSPPLGRRPLLETGIKCRQRLSKSAIGKFI